MNEPSNPIPARPPRPAGPGLLLLHAAATLCMVGVIWFVQIVHYPLFLWVASPRFWAYEGESIRRTVMVVGPLMAVEGITAIGLLAWRPPGLGRMHAWVGFLLLAIIWWTSGVHQYPLQLALSRGFDAPTHQRLLDTNWIRTVAWTLRGGLVCLMVSSTVRSVNHKP